MPRSHEAQNRILSKYICTSDHSALFALYIVGITTAGLNIVTAPVILLQQRSYLGQFCKGSAALSFLPLLAASIVITFAQFKAVDLLNTYGNDIGLYASGGGKYMVFTWAAVLFMLLGSSAEIFGEKDSELEYPEGVVWSIRSGILQEWVFDTNLREP